MGYLFILFLILGCALPRQQHRSAFVLQEAAVQEQRAGVHGGGNSKDYTFTVQVTTDDKLLFDSVWVEGQWLGLRIEKQGHLLRKDEQIAKHDTLILHASAFIPTEAGESGLPEPVTAKPPVTFTGKALIRYYQSGQASYFPVAAIRELPPVVMP